MRNTGLRTVSAARRLEALPGGLSRIYAAGLQGRYPDILRVEPAQRRTRNVNTSAEQKLASVAPRTGIVARQPS